MVEWGCTNGGEEVICDGCGELCDAIVGRGLWVGGWIGWGLCVGRSESGEDGEGQEGLVVVLLFLGAKPGAQGEDTVVVIVEG